MKTTRLWVPGAAILVLLLVPAGVRADEAKESEEPGRPRTAPHALPLPHESCRRGRGGPPEGSAETPHQTLSRGNCSRRR